MLTDFSPMRALGGRAELRAFPDAAPPAALAQARAQAVQLLDALAAEAAAQLAAPVLQLAGLLPVTWTSTPWLQGYVQAVREALERLGVQAERRGLGDSGLATLDRVLQSANALYCHRTAAEAAAMRRFPQMLSTSLWLDGRDLPAERLAVAAEHHLRVVLLLNQFLPKLLRSLVRQLDASTVAELKPGLADLIHEGLIDRLPKTPLRSFPRS